MIISPLFVLSNLILTCLTRILLFAVYSLRRMQELSSLLSLHPLSVSLRIAFKMLVFICKCIFGLASNKKICLAELSNPQIISP